MSRLLYPLFLLIGVTYYTNTADYIQVRLNYNDGNVVDGYAMFPEESGSEYILYQSSEKADQENIPGDKLKSVTYYFDDSTSVVMERIATRQYNLARQKDVTPPVWLTVIKRGPVTLYGTTPGGATVIQPDTDCYVKRVHEKEATLIHSGINATLSVMKNRTFLSMGQTYFADCPALAEKIRNKEYTYKDLEKVVDEYNEWVADKK